jgi:hypothetical protein
VARNKAIPIAAAKMYILKTDILFDGGLLLAVGSCIMVFTSDAVGVDEGSVWVGGVVVIGVVLYVVVIT